MWFDARARARACVCVYVCVYVCEKGDDVYASWQVHVYACTPIHLAHNHRYNLQYAFGLDCWGPVLNLARDPRWGRNGEAGSEDPYLMSVFSLMYTLGFQNGTDSDREFVCYPPDLNFDLI